MDYDHFIGSGHLDHTFPLDPSAPFTVAEARAAGLERHHVRMLEQLGLVRRALPGVYVATNLQEDVELRARILKLVVPEDCVVVDRHAGWLLGAQMVLAPGEHLDLQPLSLFRPAGHGRLRNSLSSSGERNLLASDVTEVNGLQVTTPLRTALDLGRVRWPDQAISGLDAMFRLGAFSREEFLAEIGRFRGMRWVTTLRAIGPLADGRSESPGESVLRLRCLECGLAGMVPQVEILVDGVLVARLDLADERLQAAVEYDGVEWHTSDTQQAHDRRRRNAVRETGYLVEAYTGANVFGRGRDIEDKLLAFKTEMERRPRRSA